MIYHTFSYMFRAYQLNIICDWRVSFKNDIFLHVKRLYVDMIPKDDQESSRIWF